MMWTPSNVTFELHAFDDCAPMHGPNATRNGHHWPHTYQYFPLSSGERITGIWLWEDVDNSWRDGSILVRCLIVLDSEQY